MDSITGTKPSYPERPRFFAMKFLRLLAKTAAAQELGADACWLLTVIATLEDVNRYRRGVTFYNEQLMPLLGFTRWHRLDAVRKACIDAGWLHYEAPPSGVRGKPGVYWVTIPSHAHGLPDGVFDEGEPSTESVDACVDSSKRPSTETVYGSVDGGVDAPVDACVELPYPSPDPYPSPNNNTSSCPKAAASDVPAGNGADGAGLLSSGERADPADTEAAEWFWSLIVAMQPGRKPPQLSKWANTIRLMRERDGRTHDQIRELYSRVNRDEFWRVNVLSPDKLREKWDDLTLRLKETGNGTSNGSGQFRGKPTVNRAGVGQTHDPARRVKWD